MVDFDDRLDWVQLSDGGSYPPAPDFISKKDARVREHLDALKHLSDAFAEGPPAPAIRDLEQGGKEHVYRSLKPGPEVPDEVPILVGECLYHLRSMLDHLALYLVPAGDRAIHEDKSQFPICSDDTAWEKSLWHIKGVPLAAQKAIRGMQPYQAVPGGIPPLWDLHLLSNVDKHRQPVIAGATAGTLFLSAAGGQFDPASSGWTYSDLPVRDVGTELARLTFSEPKPEVKVDVQFSCQLAFFERGLERQPVVDTLKRVQFGVRNLVIARLRGWL
jgi:hypothetical protein